MSTEEERPWLMANRPVFFISAGLILLFVLFGAGFTEIAGDLFRKLQGAIVVSVGWFYMASVAVFLVFVIALAVSPYGVIRLGPDDSRPDYSYVSWFAMLFSAGMGIGLMFFGVAEPVMHFSAPPTGEGGTVEAARQAMTTTFFHWGIHAWAIYIVVGLSLAYFAFRHNLPLTIRSALFPLLGRRIYGPIGHAVDIFAVIGTMFGIATSLGLGVMQVNAGLHHLFDVPESVTTQIALIALITALATISVVAGLDAGIRRLSELNLYLAAILVTFLLVAGPTVFLLSSFFQNVGKYLGNVVEMTFHTYAYEPSDWIGDWTLFYWGWWIAWSPFVGMFIARISRGRTIREFILGVLFVPAGFTFLWLTFFGGTALDMELNHQPGLISDVVSENMPVALFTLLEQLPLAQVTSLIAITLVVTFFVTSSDSGSLVIDMITSGGQIGTPTWQRIFWAVGEGVVAAVLLAAGGLVALQTASIASALPFTAVMLIMCYGLWRGLHMEAASRVQPTAPPSIPSRGSAPNWRARLSSIVRYHGYHEVHRFLHSTVSPAMEAVAAEIRARGLEVDFSGEDEKVSLLVRQGETDEFLYEVRLLGYRIPSFAFPEQPGREASIRKQYRAEVFLQDGPAHYDIMGYTRDQVIGDLLAQYEIYMHFLHVRDNREL